MSACFFLTLRILCLGISVEVKDFMAKFALREIKSKMLHVCVPHRHLLISVGSHAPAGHAPSIVARGLEDEEN